MAGIRLGSTLISYVCLCSALCSFLLLGHSFSLLLFPFFCVEPLCGVEICRGMGRVKDENGGGCSCVPHPSYWRDVESPPKEGDSFRKPGLLDRSSRARVCVEGRFVFPAVAGDFDHNGTPHFAFFSLCVFAYVVHCAFELVYNLLSLYCMLPHVHSRGIETLMLEEDMQFIFVAIYICVAANFRDFLLPISMD